MKNVLIISSSPRKGGNSDLLCDRFQAGAESAGHRVEKICLKISYWIEKLTLIIELLKKISNRCSDGNLDNEEVDKTVVELQTLVKEF